MFLDKIARIRYGAEIEEKIQDIINQYPTDYRNLSEVFRAGVIQLHKQKISKGGKDF